MHEISREPSQNLFNRLKIEGPTISQYLWKNSVRNPSSPAAFEVPKQKKAFLNSIIEILNKKRFRVAKREDTETVR